MQAPCPAGYSCVTIHGHQYKTVKPGHTGVSIHPGELLHALPVAAFAHLLVPLLLMALVAGGLFVSMMWFRLRRGPV